MMMNAFASAFQMRDSTTRGQRSKEEQDAAAAAVDPAASLRRYLQQDETAACQRMQVAALQHDITNPRVTLDEELGGQRMHYVDFFDPTSPQTSFVTESRAGYFYQATLMARASTICHKTGTWVFPGTAAAEESSISVKSMCGGALIDGTYAQVVMHGTGKYECATGGNVVQKADGDIVTFDITVCC
jgi:hypothetical protein